MNWLESIRHFFNASYRVQAEPEQQAYDLFLSPRACVFFFVILLVAIAVAHVMDNRKRN